MHVPSPPIPGYWYSSPDGKLFQVRAKLYHKENVVRIIIEDITGYRTSINPDKWDDLKMLLHSPLVRDTAQTW